jgi:hypothetical protein
MEIISGISWHTLKEKQIAKALILVKQQMKGVKKGRMREIEQSPTVKRIALTNTYINSKVEGFLQ